MEAAVVIAAEVSPGSGVLADEPVTTATLRDARGRERVVRIVGGPTRDGGHAHLAGYVVPVVGARVRADLRAPSPATQAPFGARWAPSHPAGTWPASALPVTFHLALPASRDLGEAAAGELEVAARTWGRAPCTSFRARYGGLRADVTPGDDGVNAVFFHDDAWPEELVEGALAQTIVHLDPAGDLRDADVHVNGARFRFSLDGAPGTHDARGVLVHELGHALGLGHSSDPRATMSVSGSGLRWRSLEPDDVEGVCALYPGAGDQGCDADPCPAGFSCVAGACQRPGERRDVCAPCTAEPGACEAAGDGARCVEIDAGAARGLVCGRPCAGDADCGAGFSCEPTTEAGDHQCVSRVACANGAHTCRSDAECSSPGSACRGGACVVPVDAPDGGAADSGATDGGATGEPPQTAPLHADAPPSCGCASARAPASPLSLAIATAALLARLLSRRSPPSSSSSRRRSWRPSSRTSPR